MMFVRHIEWVRTSDKEKPIVINDCKSLNINKSTEIQNNIATLNLKNSITNYASDNSTLIGDYIESGTKEVKFGEDDQFQIWCKFITDASEIDTEWWNDDNLLGTFTLEEQQFQTLENSTEIILKTIDVAYHLFNKIYTFSYGVSNNFTSCGIIRHVCRKFGEASDTSVSKSTGTQNDAGVEYIINAKFVSEGGSIADYRTVAEGGPSATLNGTITDSDGTITLSSTTGFSDPAGTVVIDSEHIAYTGVSGNNLTGCVRGIDDILAVGHSSGKTVYQGFPLILINKIWKPLFEWTSELSQTDQTNYLSEIQAGGTIFYNRAFLFWLDKNNAPHWMYPSDTPDLTIEVGEEGRRNFKLEKSVFDAVNFIIYNCGEDMYGNGITYYLYDDSSKIASLKMRYQPMSELIGVLINEDLIENPTRDTTERDIYKQFPDSYAPAIVPSFLDDANNFRVKVLSTTKRTDVSSDAEYNDTLKEAAKWRGLQEAYKITRKKSGLRYRGKIPLRGVHINPGDLLEVSNPWIGVNSQLLRVLNVTQQIISNKWETIVDVQEDEAKVIA